MNPPRSFPSFIHFPAASLAAHHLTRAESVEVTQTLTGSEKAVVTTAVSVPDKRCVNCRLVAEQRVAPGCLCAVYV